jgi:hypothetical protein
MWREILVAYHEVIFHYFYKTTGRPQELDARRRIRSQDFLTTAQQCCQFDLDVFNT